MKFGPPRLLDAQLDVFGEAIVCLNAHAKKTNIVTRLQDVSGDGDFYLTGASPKSGVGIASHTQDMDQLRLSLI